MAMDLRSDNRWYRIDPALRVHGNVVRHMGALPLGEVVSPIEMIRASNARPVVKLAFEFLPLTRPPC